MIIEDLEQQTPEWLAMRVGMVTASRVADVIAKRKRQPKDGEPAEPLACRKDYLWEIVVERLTGRSSETYVSPSMEWGIEQEPSARAAYEMATDCMVEPIGFAIHPANKWFGASPDGLVGEDGILEIKCPNSGTHLQYIINQVVPSEYVPQMLAEMACTERLWGDFVSFDPRMPKKMQLFVQRLRRDDKRIADMESDVAVFCQEVDDKLAEVQAVVGGERLREMTL